MTATVTPIHHSIDLSVGQLLQVEIDKRKISQVQLAEAMDVARQTVSAVINGHQGISKSLSKKLGIYFGHSESHWRDLSRNQEVAAMATERGLSGQSVMVDVEIEEAVASKEIAVTGFDLDRLRQASYDFAYSIKAFDLTTGYAVAVGADGITIQPGQSVNMSTVEEVCLKDDFVGSIGGTSELARFGLIISHGHQLDPGYDGSLQFSVYNPTGKPIPIRREAAVISITLSKLSRKPQRAFTQTHFSQEDTQTLQIARQHRKILADRLTEFVVEIAEVEERGARWSAEIKDLPMSHVVEPERDLAIAHVAQFLADIIHKGWCVSMYAENESAHARDQLSVLEVSRDEIVGLYKAFDVNVRESDDEISADWMDGPRGALLCSPEGAKKISVILDGMDLGLCFAKMFEN